MEIKLQFMNKAYVLGENYGDSKFNKEEQRWLITSTPVCANASVLMEPMNYYLLEQNLQLIYIY